MRRPIRRLMNGVVLGPEAVAFLVAALTMFSAPTEVAGQIITAGQVTFLNSCAYNLTVLANGRPLTRLEPSAQQSFAISSFTQGGANVVISYPNLDSARCPDCDLWTDLGGAPGTTQRAAWM